VGQAVSAAGQGRESPLEAVLQQLAELRDQVTLLDAARQRDAERIDQLAATPATPPSGGEDEEDERHKPIPAPRWWELKGAARGTAVARLRSWVEIVYRPGYGHLAAKLGPCWMQHDLCLYLLDWLSELHALLYQEGERRSLATQADWHIRLVVSAAALMEQETHSCDHLQLEDLGAGGDPWAGTP
jgi:hypothetical protein